MRDEVLDLVSLGDEIIYESTEEWNKQDAVDVSAHIEKENSGASNNFMMIAVAGIVLVLAVTAFVFIKKKK